MKRFKYSWENWYHGISIKNPGSVKQIKMIVIINSISRQPTTNLIIITKLCISKILRKSIYYMVFYRGKKRQKNAIN